MPQPYYNTLESRESADIGHGPPSNVCPNPVTPPPEENEQFGRNRLHDDQQSRLRNVPSSDNTAAGMTQSQEDSIYLSPAMTPGDLQDTFCPDDKDKMEILHDEYRDGMKTPVVVNAYESENDTASSLSTPRLSLNNHVSQLSSRVSDYSTIEFQDRSTRNVDEEIGSVGERDISTDNKHAAQSQGLAPIDLLFNRNTSTKPWSFSDRRLIPEYPSHVFQSFSHYSGTQQSDRQIYNVDVTILTVDVAQCTMTGFLLIRGLTPEHDTLQTYFTGEIIGGPPKFPDEKQYYTFRTANPSWGAMEKTDLQHWARFPAWRSLSSHAKRDINFPYPVDGRNWWEQENIFMRWKEHFLVPDHKTKSIAGASFEGFYYICLNQIQGRISGIYYHSKSEKYQQLELRHEGQPDIFNRGVTPCVEFR